jgi:hypothetical protein
MCETCMYITCFPFFKESTTDDEKKNISTLPHIHTHEKMPQRQARKKKRQTMYTRERIPNSSPLIHSSL